MRIIKNLLATLFCTTALITQPSCLRDSYSVKLSGPVTLGQSWVEFNPEPSLKPDKDWQEVGLELEQPFALDFFDEGKGPDKGKGIRLREVVAKKSTDRAVMRKHGGRKALITIRMPKAEE